MLSAGLTLDGIMAPAGIGIGIIDELVALTAFTTLWILISNYTKIPVLLC